MELKEEIKKLKEIKDVSLTEALTYLKIDNKNLDDLNYINMLLSIYQNSEEIIKNYSNNKNEQKTYFT